MHKEIHAVGHREIPDARGRNRKRRMKVSYRYESRARDRLDKNSILVPVRPIPIFLALQKSI